MPRSQLGSKRRTSVVVLLCAIALLLPACSGRQTPSSAPPELTNGRPLRPVPDVTVAGFVSAPPGSGLPRYETQTLEWEPCGDLLCATAVVPMDYNDPDGQAITLSLAKRPASGATRLGTLFVNPGGPGGSGVGFVSSFPRVGLEGYDIIGWDPRGVGRSTPVRCAGADLGRMSSMDTSPDNQTEESALIEADRDLGLACLKGSGRLLEHISTVEVARDLDLLRGLVDDNRLNLYGASYGTQIGATYASLFPGRVGRVVLDGAVDITGKPSVSQAEGFDRALRAFADWCAGRRCSLGSTQSEVLSAITGFWTRLDATPLKVGQRLLTQQQAVAGVVNVLYANAEAYPYLLQALQSVIDRGDGRSLLALADQLNQRDERGAYGQLNYAFPSIRCLDEHDLGIQGELDQAAADARAAPTIGPFIGPDLVCSMWPVAPVPKLELVGAGAAPIVVVGTTVDPATPYENAVAMAKQLQSGVLVTFRGRGHTAYGQSSCVQRLVVSYLRDGQVPTDGATC